MSESTPEPKSKSLNFHTHSSVPGPSQIFSSTDRKGAESSIFLWRRPSSRKCLRVSSIVERRSNTIAM